MKIEKTKNVKKTKIINGLIVKKKQQQQQERIKLIVVCLFVQRVKQPEQYKHYNKRMIASTGFPSTDVVDSF